MAAKNIDPLKDGIQKQSLESGPQDWNVYCGVCHAGGGGMEYDRNMNWYSSSSPNGDAYVYRDPYWDGTQVRGGVIEIGWQNASNKAEIDCLLCHLDASVLGGGDGNGRAWYKSMGCSATNPIGPMNDMNCDGVNDPTWFGPPMPTAGPFNAGTAYDMFNRNLALKARKLNYAASLGIGAKALMSFDILTGLDWGGTIPTVAGQSIVGTPKSENCAVCHARNDNTPGLPGMVGMKVGYGNFGLVSPAGTTLDTDKTDPAGRNDVYWFELGCKTGMGKRAHRINAGPNAHWGMSLFNMMFGLGKNPGAPIVDEELTSPMLQAMLGPSAKVVTKERMPDYDVHDMSGMQCADCHYNLGSEKKYTATYNPLAAGDTNSITVPGHESHGLTFPTEVVRAIDHQFAQADSFPDTKGKNNLDGTVSCESCHTTRTHARLKENGGPLVSPNPAAAHAAFPESHFHKLSCTTCHVPEVYGAPGRLKYRDWTVGPFKSSIGGHYNFRNMLDWNFDLITGSHRPMPVWRRWATKDHETKIYPVLPSVMPIWVEAIPNSTMELGSEPGVVGVAPPTTSPQVGPVDWRENVKAAKAVAKARPEFDIRLNGGNMVPLFDGFSLADSWEIDTKAEIDAMIASFKANTTANVVKLRLFEADFDVTHGVPPKEWSLGGSKRGGCKSCHSSANPTHPGYSPHSIGFFEGTVQPIAGAGQSIGMPSMGIGAYDPIKNWFALFADFDCTALCGMGTLNDAALFDQTGAPIKGTKCGAGSMFTVIDECVGMMGMAFDAAMGFPSGTAKMMGMWDGVSGLQGFTIRETVAGHTYGCNPFAGAESMSPFPGQSVNNCMPNAAMFNGTCSGAAPPMPGQCSGGFRNGGMCMTDTDCTGRLTDAKELAQNPYGLIYQRQEVRSHFKINLQQSGSSPSTYKVTWPMSVDKNPSNPNHVNSWDQAFYCFDYSGGNPFAPGVKPCADGEPIAHYVSANQFLGYTQAQLDRYMGGIPVPQKVGTKDSVLGSATEAVCRTCHTGNRHHALTGKPVPQGTVSSYPPATNGTYACETCHGSFQVTTNCATCHVTAAGEGSIHHISASAQSGDCKTCHGSFVNNKGDGHYIPTTAAKLTTPAPSYAFKTNPGAKGEGACDFCHTFGSIGGVNVDMNIETHHFSTGFGLDTTKCTWCHLSTNPDPKAPGANLAIRACENCHGVESLHNIQVDTNNDGVLYPGQELAGMGHIGNNTDCFGCHGYAPLSTGTPVPTGQGPGHGAVVPHISKIDKSIFTAGTSAQVILTGSAFTNMDGMTGFQRDSKVVFTAYDGTTTTLTPNPISLNSMTVTIPGTLAAGNYMVRALKVSQVSNPVAIMITPKISITSVTSKSNTVTIVGTGFGTRPTGSGAYIRVTINGVVLQITSWTDTQIVGTGSYTDGATVIVYTANGIGSNKNLDADGDGYTIAQGDCNDNNKDINPGATEICDGIDNDCDGLIDDADPSVANRPTWYVDADNDGYGNPSVTKLACVKPAGYVGNNTDCNDANAAINPAAKEICTDGIDNNCNKLVDNADPICIVGTPCTSNTQCLTSEYCYKAPGFCGDQGTCVAKPTSCPQVYDPVCGCDGITYPSACDAQLKGVSVAKTGSCSYTHYFPSIKDNIDLWENYVTVQAKDAVPMCVTQRVYNLQGTLVGKYRNCTNDPAANAPSIAPYARVASKPALIAGSTTNPIPVEGSMIIETDVPAIATTNAIAWNFEGFSIYEAAKPRSVHSFPKQYDGPDNYSVYLLVQNIYDTPRKVTIKYSGKTVTSPGHGATMTTTIPAFGTLKVRPSTIAGGINIDGSSMVYSDLNSPGDGLGPPVPAMCRYEIGSEAMSIYESVVTQPSLYFPTIKDGKFGGTLEYQNFGSIVNPNPVDAIVNIYLYNKAGVEEARLLNQVIPAGGKQTWRPSGIKGGSWLTPIDFEGSVVVTSNISIVGQTNTIYPGVNKYNIDAFDLLESSISNSRLFFPKAFDNIVGTSNNLYDNFVYVQNPDGTAKNIKVEQFNNNGAVNGVKTVTLNPYAMYIFRPKDLVTDGTGQFRGSVIITEINGLKIAGAIKYEIHSGSSPYTPVDAMTNYRSMGQ